MSSILKNIGKPLNATENEINYCQNFIKKGKAPSMITKCWNKCRKDFQIRRLLLKIIEALAAYPGFVYDTMRDEIYDIVYFSLTNDKNNPIVSLMASVFVIAKIPNCFFNFSSFQ